MPESHGCQDPVKADRDPVQDWPKINCSIEEKNAGMCKEFSFQYFLALSSFNFRLSSNWNLILINIERICPKKEEYRKKKYNNYYVEAAPL